MYTGLSTIVSDIMMRPPTAFVGTLGKLSCQTRVELVCLSPPSINLRLGLRC